MTAESRSSATRSCASLERAILLQIIDNRWREHLYEMDYLREGIHLRGFAQIDPLVAYKNEGFAMFEALMHSIWEEFARLIFHVEVEVAPRPRSSSRRPSSRLGSTTRGGPEQPSALGQAAVATAAGPDVGAERLIEGRAQGGNGAPVEQETVVKDEREKIGRNDPAGAARARSTRSATGPDLEPRDDLLGNSHRPVQSRA